jgi:hypothetical protein
MDEFAPPLPPAVTSVLDAASLAYLATVEDGLPHLSLMNFSHVTTEPELGPVLVMTTRRDTKKFRALEKTPQVAVLIHDFNVGGGGGGARAGGGGDSEGAAATAAAGAAGTAAAGGGTLSITVYGDAVIATGPAAERLRAAHLARNPRYPQFIVGDHIAVLAIVPSLARMCNVADVVTTWSRPARSASVGGGGGCSEPPSPVVAAAAAEAAAAAAATGPSRSAL